MLSLALALWLPAYLNERAMGRRLAAFTGTSDVLAVDLGGRRRSRGARRGAPERRASRIVIGLENAIRDAAVHLSPTEVLAAMGIASLFGLLLGWLALGSPLFGLAGAALGAALPIGWLRLRKKRRRAAFQKQLPDTVALLASAVRSGHSLLQGLELAAKEAPSPTSEIVDLVVREIGLGAAQEDALERLAERYPSEDIDLIVSVITIHQQAGGSLSRVLDVIAATIRERVRMAADISALTSQQRVSAYVLAALPVMVTVALFLISGEYAAALLAPGLLRIVFFGAIGMAFVGFLAMRKIAAIDV